jgi:hypothetical protein
VRDELRAAGRMAGLPTWATRPFLLSGGGMRDRRAYIVTEYFLLFLVAGLMTVAALKLFSGGKHSIQGMLGGGDLEYQKDYEKTTGQKGFVTTGIDAVRCSGKTGSGETAC